MVKRRTLLAGVGLSVTLPLAGYSISDTDFEYSDEVSGHVRPDGEPEHVPPTFQCDEEQFERHWVGYSEDDVQFGDTAGFSLRVNETSFEYGDTVEIVLENTASERGSTGNKYKYNLEIYTKNGWQEIRGWTEKPRGYTDEAHGHPPGSGFEWVMELTEDGIAAASSHEDALQVCPALQSGRYRFTFWSLIGAEVVAVEFDLQRDT